jgi:hypothetical protein
MITEREIDVLSLILECNEGRCNYPMDAGWHGGRPGYGYSAELLEEVGDQFHWANRIDLAKKLNISDEILKYIIQLLVDDGRLEGCNCGCRGDFAVIGTEFCERIYGIPRTIPYVSVPTIKFLGEL